MPRATYTGAGAMFWVNPNCPTASAVLLPFPCGEPDLPLARLCGSERPAMRFENPLALLGGEPRRQMLCLRERIQVQRGVVLGGSPRSLLDHLRAWCLTLR